MLKILILLSLIVFMELEPDLFTQFRGSTNFPGTLLLENPLFLDGH
jgi:hypothetical protein